MYIVLIEYQSFYKLDTSILSIISVLMVYHKNDRKADHAILDGPVGKCTLFVLDKQPYYPMLKYTIFYPGMATTYAKEGVPYKNINKK
jgi:hypothetical protein